MSRPISPTVAVSLLFVIGFVVLQLMPANTARWGPGCVTTIEGPDPDAQWYSEGASFGFPLPFLEVSEEGCFEERVRKMSFDYPGLLTNLLVFAGGGVVTLLAVQALVARRRQA